MHCDAMVMAFSFLRGMGKERWFQIPFWFVFFVGNQALEEVAQRVCGVSRLGDLQDLSRCSPEQLALEHRGWTR